MATSSTSRKDIESESDGSSDALSKSPHQPVNDAAGEETPLLNHRQNDDLRAASSKNRLTPAVITILLIGEMVSHADTTLIFATAPQIASELGNLRAVSWLAVAYTLAVCTMQPLYGRLSDVFGRKNMLLFAYTVLTFGCILCGLSTAFWQIVAGRAVSGIGGAGVMTMASIIITDSVPKKDFARYRSYINLATTLGRSIGGPLGGLISDTLGWPWLFYTRIPLFLLSVGLCVFKLEDIPRHADSVNSTRETLREKLASIDYRGALLLAKVIISLILLLDKLKHGFQDPIVYLLIAIVFVFGQLFVFWELWAAPRPIFDLRILTRPNAALSYLVDYLQVSAQVGMMFAVPMYFQVTQRSSVAVSGLHIMPAVVANTVGALLSGRLMQQSRRHRIILVSSGLVGSITYVLLLARWNGNTNWVESMYIIPGGLATGIAQSASFVTMASHLDQGKMAMATGWFFLCSSLGTASGVTATNVLVQLFFGRNLKRSLPESPNLIKRVMSDIEVINDLTGDIRRVVVEAFVGGLKSTYILGFCSCIVSSILALCLRNPEL